MFYFSINTNEIWINILEGDKTSLKWTNPEEGSQMTIFLPVLSDDYPDKMKLNYSKISFSRMSELTWSKEETCQNMIFINSFSPEFPN